LNNNKPIITIGITAFNEGELLSEAWNSVLNQITDNWETVMVLDGGGDKKTRKVFDSIQHLTLTKYSFSENQGTYTCRTKAIELTETEWYFHLDADDLLPSNAIDLVLNHIKDNPEAEYIAGACKHFGQGPDQIRYPEIDPELLVISPHFFAQAPITKKLFTKIGSYHIPRHFFHADWDFWLSVYEKKITGHIMDEVLYERRRRNDGITWQNIEALDKGLELIIKRHTIVFNSNIRKRKARYNLYEKLARQYKSIGKRNKAAKFARKALNYGNSIQAFDTIFQEEQMLYLRYLIRRLGRYYNKSSILY